jgi:hypothetical protein
MTAERVPSGRRLSAAVLVPLAVIAASAAAIAAIVLLGEGGDAPPTVEVQPTEDPGSTFLSGSVIPGDHTVRVFNPPVSLNIGEGWSALFEPDDDLIVLQGPALFVITRVEEVWDKEEQEKVPVPADLVEYFRTHEDFQAGEPVDLEIDGYPARQLDLTATFAADTVHFPPSEYLRIGTDDRSRVIVIDVDGTTVAAITTAEADQFDTAIAQSQPIVESIEFLDE